MYLFLAVSRSYQFRVISKIKVNFRFREYSMVLSRRFGLMDSVICSSNLFMFDVEESVFRSLTQLFCLGDLENLDQLPVLQ